MKTNALLSIMALLICFGSANGQAVRRGSASRTGTHNELPNQQYVPRDRAAQPVSPGGRYSGQGYFTHQVNVDASGNNILGDAANEPSIAVDPVNPLNMVIGWRQFDDVNNDFRQAGYGYSSDGGQTWTFPGVINPGVFRSDPVLDFDAGGNFFYNSLTTVTGDYTCDVYKSTNGGATWGVPVAAKGGDKQWMAIDVTNGPGSGNIYSAWNSSFTSCNPGFFTRSADAGASFEDCIMVDGNPYWGTMAVGPEGELYIAGAGSWEGIMVVKSTNAQIPGASITWNSTTQVSMDGYITGSDPINPVGLLGQANIDVDRSTGPGRGNVYVLASMARLSFMDPADVFFAKSTDGGQTFGEARLLNTDTSITNYQWFGTMSVAPNGRIDAIWLDTRDAPEGSHLSALYYTCSFDQGETWSANTRFSELFDPHLGYPQQAKMGDYFDMVSDNAGAHVAWADTLNGEQDVYYTNITPFAVGLAEKTVSAAQPEMTCTPNPFRDVISIRYSIPADAVVTADICDLSGRRILSQSAGWQTRGTHSLSMEAAGLPAGFYLCRLSADGMQCMARLVKVK